MISELSLGKGPQWTDILKAHPLDKNMVKEMVQTGKGKYSEEFKQEALRICDQQGVRAVGAKLGISIKTLYLWQRKKRLEHGRPPKGLKPAKQLKKALNG